MLPGLECHESKPGGTFQFMKRFSVLLTAVMLLVPAFSAAGPVDIMLNDGRAIGASIQYLAEDDVELPISKAIQAYRDGKFVQSGKSFLVFGIAVKPTWLRFEVSNPGDIAVLRRLSVRTSWLERVDAWVIVGGKTVKRYRGGDSLPFGNREIRNRYFQFDFKYPPGLSTVYIRAQTVDPMVLPVYLETVTLARDKDVAESYTYGVFHGGLLLMMLYNLMLFVRLRTNRYLFFAAYLFLFLAVNYSYTGYSFMNLWPGSVVWQQWSILLLMVMFATSGLLFALRFLNMRQEFPRINRLVLAVCLLFLLLQMTGYLLDSHKLAALSAFIFVFVFSAGMVLLGAIALYSGNRSAKFFLIGSVTHVTMSSVTAMVAWGILPYSTLGFRSVEIGMMLDAVLLAMALADQFKITQEEKLLAEKLAKMDPLTEVNNRRAFYELVKPLWETGVRNSQMMSVVMIDIDHFKQINDRYGHACGDDVLVSIARLLGSSVRSGDVFCRWGGEEFLLLLPETSLEQAGDIAQRFREMIEKTPLDINYETISVTASFGVAQTRLPGLTLDGLISQADEQLYIAKELGRNRVCCHDGEVIA